MSETRPVSDAAAALVASMGVENTPPAEEEAAKKLAVACGESSATAAEVAVKPGLGPIQMLSCNKDTANTPAADKVSTHPVKQIARPQSWIQSICGRQHRDVCLVYTPLPLPTPSNRPSKAYTHPPAGYFS